MTPEDEILYTEFAVIAILGAYIKRQTNLLLLKEKMDKIPPQDRYGDIAHYSRPLFENQVRYQGEEIP